MNRYLATDSQGETHKRSSKTRTYTHAVVAYRTQVHHNWPTAGAEHLAAYKMVSWAGSSALADSRATYFANKGFTVEIVEAVSP